MSLSLFFCEAKEDFGNRLPGPYLYTMSRLLNFPPHGGRGMNATQCKTQLQDKKDKY